MKTRWSLLASGVLIAAIGIQFIRPDQTNPPTDPARDISSYRSLPADVRAILERSCYDCHSNRTVWPWYSQVAPVSWLVARDVNEGRRHLNFSEWSAYPPGRQNVKLESLIREVEDDGMPPGIYLMMHGDAALTPAQREQVTGWASALLDSLEPALPPVEQ